jgi:ABC-type bacteriocin/lantibiotic exporter with double-glycine peptidase domain
VLCQRFSSLFVVATLLKVPFFSDQTDQCGPATLASVLSYWGKAAALSRLRDEMYIAKLHGTLPMDVALAAEAHGLKIEMVRGDLSVLQTELRSGRPVIAMVNLGFSALPVDHYVVVTGIDEERKGVYMHSAGVENKFVPYKKFMGSWKKTDYWALLAQLP